MKVLHLTLKKRWFDMIASGEKKEEYREIKPYWDKRFIQGFMPLTFVGFDEVEFTNGYGKNSPTLLIKSLGISIGTGKEEWGAPKEKVYIISLGKILNP